MQGTMKAVIKPSAGPGAELATVPIPRIGPKEVLVKVRAASICGTDVHIYTWDPWAQGRIKPPLIFGHELAGDVVEVGNEVTRLKVGDYVSAESHVVCGTCHQCLTGQGHVCQNYRILGVDIPGVFAEYVALPEANAWKNDKNLPPEIASIQDPLGNAVHTALSGQIVGNTVAVIGSGPIGVLAVAVSKAAGAAAVFATDINDYRLDLAKKMGAVLTVNSRETDPVEAILKANHGVGVDVVLEMSGNPTAIRQGFKMLRNGGRISLLGIPSKPMELDLANDIVFKGAIVHGITGRRLYDTWYKMAGLFRAGLDVRPAITHRFRMDEFEEGMKVMISGNSGKVVLFP